MLLNVVCGDVLRQPVPSLVARDLRDRGWRAIVGKTPSVPEVPSHCAVRKTHHCHTCFPDTERGVPSRNEVYGAKTSRRGPRRTTRACATQRCFASMLPTEPQLFGLFKRKLCGGGTTEEQEGYRALGRHENNFTFCCCSFWFLTRRERVGTPRGVSRVKQRNQGAKWTQPYGARRRMPIRFVARSLQTYGSAPTSQKQRFSIAPFGPPNGISPPAALEARRHGEGDRRRLPDFGSGLPATANLRQCCLLFGED